MADAASARALAPRCAIEILSAMLGPDLGEHREDRLNGLLEDFLLGFHVAAERRQLGDRRALAHAEFAAAVAEEVEHRDALGDACGMIGGELEDAVAEPNLPGALTRRSQERFRRRRMRILFQEMMFHDPGMVVAEPVGDLELRQRILVKAEFVALLPRTRQLQLIEDAEFHDVSPWTSCCFQAVYCRQGASPASAQFRRMEEIDVRIML
jgi:hypothetical protein